MNSEPDIAVFRPDRPGIRKVLSDPEAETMEIIWARPADAGTTVMNAMARLMKKNLLRTAKSDQAYVYYPNFTVDEFVSRFAGLLRAGLNVGLLARIFDVDKGESKGEPHADQHGAF